MAEVNSSRIRETIIEFCRINPDLANDDKRLIANIWWSEGWRDPQLYDKLRSVSSPETIRRTRAKLVEEGLIQVDPTVRALRRKEERAVRTALKGEQNG